MPIEARQERHFPDPETEDTGERSWEGKACAHIYLLLKGGLKVKGMIQWLHQRLAFPPYILAMLNSPFFQ